MLRAAPVLASLFMLTACTGLPDNAARKPSSALTDTGGTRLGRAIAPLQAVHPGKTGIHPLGDGRDAFAARVLLARAAERSLDVQYYIFRGDTTGLLLCESLWQAAERGVRVRLLLDDQNTGGMDAAIAALDAHPNIEVRLFNPFVHRGFRLVDFVIDFRRVNRRMHNKSFTADGQVTIVGGRNVGDEYFGAESHVAFADLDVVAVGAVVREVSAAFDAYWNSASAYPAASLMPAAAPDSAARVRAAWEKLHATPQAARYLEVMRTTPLVEQLLAGRLALEWAPARVVQDDPAKVLHPPDRRELQMLPLLEAALGKPERELDLVSPYFVPTEEGTAALSAIAARGVKVRVLTNSLAATDVAPVYAGYTKYREPLLRAGVRIYELKRAARMPGEKARGKGGSSNASLHAKTFSVDRGRVFVGSFNFDPRSAWLNTEMGVVVESPALAGQLSSALDRDFARSTYEVRLTADRRSVEWIERGEAGEVRHTSTPETGVMRRMWIGFLSIMPIEWLL
jgi:putative cardiolipin synthase